MISKNLHHCFNISECFQETIMGKGIHALKESGIGRNLKKKMHSGFSVEHLGHFT